jgi:hypothetical protein
MSATDAKPVPYDTIAYAKRGNVTLYGHPHKAHDIFDSGSEW